MLHHVSLAVLMSSLSLSLTLWPVAAVDGVSENVRMLPDSPSPSHSMCLPLIVACMVVLLAA